MNLDGSMSNDTNVMEAARALYLLLIFRQAIGVLGRATIITA